MLHLERVVFRVKNMVVVFKGKRSIEGISHSAPVANKVQSMCPNSWLSAACYCFTGMMTVSLEYIKPALSREAQKGR